MTIKQLQQKIDELQKEVDLLKIKLLAVEHNTPYVYQYPNIVIQPRCPCCGRYNCIDTHITCSNTSVSSK